MRISHLIEALQKIQAEHGDVAVITEGCDCTGDSYSAEYHPERKGATWCEKAYVEITRSEYRAEYGEKRDAGFEYDNFAHEWKPRK